MRPKTDWHLTATAAIAVENSHNRGGGLVQPLERAAEALGLVARGRRRRPPRRRPHLERRASPPASTLATYGRLADTASVCFSKGLGAPVGSVLVSSAERIATARLWRKRLGGGMRQVGVLAAACLYALDHHLPRLGEDHEHAQLLAKRLGVDPSSVETNMVVLDDVAAPVVAEAAKAQGVLVSQVSAAPDPAGDCTSTSTGPASTAPPTSSRSCSHRVDAVRGCALPRLELRIRAQRSVAVHRSSPAVAVRALCHA